VFGVSFPELLVLGTVALLVLGPDKLPGMLRTMGQWLAKLRRLTTEVRHQSGIDEVLRAEGFDGGLNELRGMMRGGTSNSYTAPVRQPTPEQFVPDKTREYPVEGPDAYGALPEDLVAPPAGLLPTSDTSVAVALPEATAVQPASAENALPVGSPTAAGPAVTAPVPTSTPAPGPAAPKPVTLPPRPTIPPPATVTPPATLPKASTETGPEPAGSGTHPALAVPPTGPASGAESPETKP
jgi:sec-independent protein translocase protein TatB